MPPGTAAVVGAVAGKGAVAMSVAFMVASIVIGLMWASAFG
jgi:hypothetical protein